MTESAFDWLAAGTSSEGLPNMRGAGPGLSVSYLASRVVPRRFVFPFPALLTIYSALSCIITFALLLSSHLFIINSPAPSYAGAL